MSKTRAITPNPPADFTPDRGNYVTLKPFRYWCQKVLPLVYDDSLSYYELLCKVVDYLNKTMQDVETLNDDVTALHTAYTQLQNYVNNYFSTLDVQEEINNKLDEMAESGELSKLMQPYLQEFNTKVENLQTQINSLVLNAGNPDASSAEIAQARGKYETLNDRIGADVQPANVSAINDDSFDLNNAEINRIYAIGVKCVNCPVNHGTLVTFADSLTYGKIIGQLIFAEDGLYTRFLNNNGVWSEWGGDTSVKPAINSAINDNSFNLNNAEINRIYSIGVKCVNCPVKHGTLVTFSDSLTYGKIIGQLIFAEDGLYSRFLNNSGVWSKWSEWSDSPTYYPVLNAFTNLLFFGDSLTYSAVFTAKNTSRKAFKPYPDILANLCNANFKTYATGGENAKELWDRYSDYIVKYDNCLAIIFIGTNDGLTDTLNVDCPSDKPWEEWTAETNTCYYAKFIEKNKSVGNKVLLITCNDGQSIETTNKVIIECANRFGCGYIINKKFNETEYHTSNGYYDSVHYNDIGYAKMANYLFNTIVNNAIYINN